MPCFVRERSSTRSNFQKCGAARSWDERRRPCDHGQASFLRMPSSSPDGVLHYEVVELQYRVLEGVLDRKKGEKSCRIECPVYMV